MPLSPILLYSILLSDGQMVVASPPMESSAAQKAKLQKGDKVMQINGQPTKGMSSFDVVR